MASGWAKDGAVQDQIDASVEDAVKRARQALSSDGGAVDCVDCGEPMDDRFARAIGAKPTLKHHGLAEGGSPRLTVFNEGSVRAFKPVALQSFFAN